MPAQPAQTPWTYQSCRRFARPWASSRALPSTISSPFLPTPASLVLFVWLAPSPLYTRIVKCDMQLDTSLARLPSSNTRCLRTVAYILCIIDVMLFQYPDFNHCVRSQQEQLTSHHLCHQTALRQTYFKPRETGLPLPPPNFQARLDPPIDSKRDSPA